MPFEKYAKYYDIVHSGKDYDAEIAYLVELFGYFGQPRHVLDLGCGTGEHMMRLQQLGYSVAGLDLSKDMIARAREKGLLSTWNADMRAFELDSRFDACICMFGGIGYLKDIHDLVNTLECVKEHLEIGGLFIFDYWNGLAVLKERPKITVRTVAAGELEVLRIARPKLNPVNQICEVNYACLVKQGDRYIEEFEETHSIRFYFPGEIRLALSTAGFEHLATYPFMKSEGEPSEESWSVTTIARRRGR